VVDRGEPPDDTARFLFVPVFGALSVRTADIAEGV